MADIERARELLREIERDAHGVPSYLATRALRALDGDGAEEWWARSTIAGTWHVLRQGCCSPERVAERMTEADARRIARLPALERAARELLSRQITFSSEAGERAIENLEAALNQEGQ